MDFDLERYEAVMARALGALDPWASLQEALGDPSLPANLREALACVEEDGLRISGLLVAKLRFERLTNGSTVLARWFEEDPQGFTAAFRRYHASVPSTALFPSDEVAGFERWRRG